MDIPEGERAADFDVTGVAAGVETITASAGGADAEVDVEVVEVLLGFVISEVLYDTPGDDNGKEWVELFNGTGADIDLSGYSLASGGTDYTYSTFQLTGTLPAGGCFVVGGPDSSADNGMPTFDQAEDFDPDLQNSGTTADAVALFDVTASAISNSTVPIDAVVYGGSNDNGLLGPDGSAAPVDVEDAGGGASVERVGEAWALQLTPTPGDCTAALTPASR